MNDKFACSFILSNASVSQWCKLNRHYLRVQRSASGQRSCLCGLCGGSVWPVTDVQCASDGVYNVSSSHSTTGVSTKRLSE